MILHTVNKSPPSSTCLQECLALCGDNDSLLLIEDGVYAAAMGNPEWLNSAARIYALRGDIEARGIALRLAGDVTVIDDAGFVELAATHDKVISWY